LVPLYISRLRMDGPHCPNISAFNSRNAEVGGGAITATRGSITSHYRERQFA
jgi:hypothetical protein